MSEKQNIEYKESWRDEYLKWVCGFANAQGGCIYIGISDDGKVIGVKDSKKLLEDIPNKIKDTIGIIADINLLKKDGLEYIEIIVNPSTYPVNYYGEYYYRSGSTKQQLRGSALTEFLIKKTGFRWEAVPVDNISIDDLDKESFDIFRREAVRTKRMSQEDVKCSNKELLEKLGLIINGKLKRAAVMLFYRNPQRLFTGCYVKIGKFGIGSDLQYQDVIEGSLILIADRAIDIIYLKYLKAKITYEHDKRVETYPFEREAVREALYNALIHCKWEDGIPIQIRIEDETMYISNSCSFPSDWTIQNLMRTHNSRPYNPDIAGTFYRAGYIEAWGRGVQKIREACKELGVPYPKYTLLGNDLTIKFTALKSALINEASASSLTQEKEEKNRTTVMTKTMTETMIKTMTKSRSKIIELIYNKPNITREEIAKKLNLTLRGVDWHIKGLKADKVIERVGANKGGYWKIKENLLNK